MIRLLFGLALGSGVLMVLSGVRGIVVLALPTRRARSRSTVDETALVEALAVWTEQVRDTISGARGLEQALTVTAETAPNLVRPAARRLAARLGVTPLPRALRTFAVEVDHPLADFVVAALVVAAENHVRDFATLLSHLAECCRDDARMRTRVWVARARLRSGVRIIAAVISVFVIGLLILQREYLRAYSTPEGVVVLGLVIAMFSSALLMLMRMGRFETVSRFVAHDRVVGS